LNFEGCKAVGVAVMDEPHSGKMSPPKLAQHTVATITELVSYANWVVTPCSMNVIFNKALSNLKKLIS
jgi:hypothetical protein